MTSATPHNAGRVSATPDWYDFTGPLWQQYHAKTRKKVRFPRGYKEVSLLTKGSR
jgi:hypothetical protein